MRFKILFLLSFVFFFAATFSEAQPIKESASIRYVTVLPATCNPATRGEVLVYKISAPAGLYRCSSNNTWTEVGAGSGGGSNYLGTFQKSSLPAAPATGSVAIVTNGTRGAWYYNGSIWVPFDSGARVNMLDFCNPVTTSDCTSGIQAAINAVAYNEDTKTGGGTIVFPAGYTFNFAGTLSLAGKHAVTFEGTNTGRQQKAQPNLNFTASGAATAINAAQSAAFNIVKMHMTYSHADYTGKYITYGTIGLDSANVSWGIVDSYFNSIGTNGRKATAFLDLGMAVNGSIERTGFQGAKHAIIGTTIVVVGNNAVNKWYANNIGIKNCSFNFISDYVIWNPNLNWEIVGNDFNPSVDGQLKTIGMDGQIPVENLNILRNYWGDAAGWQSGAAISLASAYGANIDGNTVTIPTNGKFLSINASGPISFKNNVIAENEGFHVVFANTAINTTTDVITAIDVSTGNSRVGNGNKVTLTTTGSLSGTGLAVSTTYYIVQATATTFKLSSTLGGTAIDLTGQGTGDHAYHIASQAVGIESDTTASSAITIENNQISTATPIASVGSLIRSSGKNNTHKGGPGLIPDFMTGSITIGSNGNTPSVINTDQWGVSIGQANNVKAVKGLGAGIHQINNSNEGRPAGDLVIRARTDDTTQAGIDLVTGNQAESKLYVNSTGVRASVPLTAKGKRNVIVPVSTETDFIKATATLNFGTVPSYQTKEVTFAFEGAAIGDVPYLSPPSGLEAGLMLGLARVSAANIVTVRIANVTNADIVSTGRTWNAEIRKIGISLGNYALAANGSSAAATSYLDTVNRGAENAIDGDRTTKGNSSVKALWQSGATPTPGAPQIYTVNFNTSRQINEINLYMVQNADNNPAEPDETTPATAFQLRDFRIEYWDGDSWELVDNEANVTDNEFAMRNFGFATKTTSQIRVFITEAQDGAARIVELEAFKN